MRSEKILIAIFCSLILGLQVCSAQLQPILMNTLFTPFSNSEMAAYEDRFVVASDEHVNIYQISNSGLLSTMDQLAFSSVLYLSTCGSYLIIIKTNDYVDCQIYTYDLNAYELKDSLEFQELIPVFATCNEDYCFISDLFNGLYVFHINSDGDIFIESQFPEIYFNTDGIAACNRSFLLTSYCGMSCQFSIADISDVHNIHFLPTCDFLEDTYEIGLTNEDLVMAGTNSGQSITKLGYYEDNECYDLSTISLWHCINGKIRSDDNLVIVQGKVHPSFHGRLQVCKVTSQSALHHECNIDIPIIDNYILCDRLVYIRDVNNNDLYIYGLFGPPDLRVSRLPNNSIRLNWEAVPGATSYRVYAAQSVNGIDRLVVETSELEYIIPMSTNDEFYRVTSVR